MLDTNKYEAFSFSEFWDTLSTSFVQYEFIFFTAALLLLYYIFPKKVRWTVLLAGSIAFYSIAGLHPLITVLLTSFIVYASALLIEGTEKKNRKKRRLITAVGVVILLSVLCFVKLYSLLDWKFYYVIPLGISYYTFSSIAYLADIYWGKDKAEQNYFKLLLFELYFPKILQGPISRHKTLGSQLLRGNSFNAREFGYGLQLAVWGYFKKMVIADRISMFTSTVWANYGSLGGAILLVNAVLSAFQLYADFSGCMDIARGISQALGIDLERNFDRPFSSKSAAEFWRRWHISLGSWFKDYVFMPLVISPKLIKLSGTLAKRFGKRAGKAVMLIIPPLVVWLLTGIWHGTGINYVLWGVYWALIIITTSVFAPEITKLTKLLRINTDSAGWSAFQVIRTFLLFCAARVISTMPTPADMLEYFRRIFTEPRIWQLFDGTLLNQGLNGLEWCITLVLIGLLCVVFSVQGKRRVRETIAGWNLVSRCAFYAMAVILILIFGIYGPGFDSSSFVYMNF